MKQIRAVVNYSNSTMECISEHNISNHNIDTYTKTEVSELVDIDMIILSKDELTRFSESSNTKQLIDNGVIVYLQDKSIKIEDFAKNLSIPYEGKSHTKGFTNLGIVLFRAHDEYFFVNMGASHLVEESNLDETTIKSYTEDEINRLRNSDTSIRNIISLKEETIKDLNLLELKDISSTQLYMQGFPSISYDRWNSGSIDVTYYGDVKAAAHITQYVYDKDQETVGSDVYEVFDVVSHVRVGPESDIKVKKYKVRMHTNITYHDIIDEIYIPSNTSSTVGFELSGSSGGVGAGASTSWSFSPNSQSMVNYTPSADYRDWTATPVSPAYGDTMGLYPGIRSVNKKSQSYSSGAFTSFREVQLLNAYLIVFNTSTTYEIGRWW